MSTKKLDSLINKFIEEKRIENGLTIPFIIGSYLLIEKKQYNASSINDCFESFFNKDKYFNLHFCDKIKELVVSNIYFEDEKIYLTNSQIKRIGNIISTDNSLDLLNSKEDLYKHMYKIYNDDLIKSWFSKVNGKWGNFETTEIRIIEN